MEKGIRSEGVIFGGVYKPRNNPFRHSYRAEYAEIVLLGAIFVFLTMVLKMAGAI